jgi:hypothetical protein
MILNFHFMMMMLQPSLACPIWTKRPEALPLRKASDNPLTAKLACPGSHSFEGTPFSDYGR